jgi:NAD(P)-dependent dehydrogenase (short-subunit alcohol dehydrogenase family)
MTEGVCPDGSASRKGRRHHKGGRGIGRAIAIHYVAEGAIVVTSSHTVTDLEGTLIQAGFDGHQGLAVMADAMNRENARCPQVATVIASPR